MFLNICENFSIARIVVARRRRVLKRSGKMKLKSGTTKSRSQEENSGSKKIKKIMNYIALGKSNLLVSRTALSSMALANIKDDEKASEIINMAWEGGVNFFDTSRRSPESEERLGNTLHGDIRKDIFVSTKTQSLLSWKIDEDIEKSLEALKTDYIDLYQLENPAYLPEEYGEDGVVEKLRSLKKEGKIHHFGVCTDNFDIARKLIHSKVEWETLQFPFNLLCTQDILELMYDCREKDIGFIAEQPLCSGIIQNVPLAVGFFSQNDYAVPVWGIQKLEELQQILYFSENPPVIDEAFNEEVENYRAFFN